MQCHTVPVRALGAVIDFLYPPHCLICTASVAPRPERVCGVCWSTIESIDGSHRAWMESGEKLVRGGLVDGLHALYLFEKNGALQRVLHLLKYGGMHSLGLRLGRELGRSLAGSGILSEIEAIVPVPLHGAKLRERGYNQSEKICRGIREVSGAPVVRRALGRTRNTPSQTTLKMHEREANVRDAFSVLPVSGRAIQGKTILLVDDVLTTGSTLRSCACALKDAGVRSVVCATVAIAE